mmetsp:Transcript_9713/g.18887  ORF Transcript_9713/g.18887 Transcript_9713/m.18887 type:complete len:266 (+) Transcript_9713:61-858(+)|eukprot:CAMPEP_0173389344 /NCGR_PEP_ID=MMETSP1356-20130122/11444_1 /TAXON_ID=77927 ORGANISM="Hemiselmis virescens, Strain PCC157" /NCGR_SAMPLE_ID=MMETSP1356 /ASSEMBLY_ACC=CAM_ASM_000847 /LENGTH=265 /DNA_ID=CAMNT_0014346475 /DNA_START=55 /DNA_END=852 /DNA_ORIENTATION=+
MTETRLIPALLAAVVCVMLMAPARTLAAEQCKVYADSEGPLYLAGAPFKNNGVVCAPGPASDVVLTVSGTVRSADCGGVVPFAVLDLWQASSEADGTSYYGCDRCKGDSSKWPDGAYYCRGKVTADKDGAFVFRTVKPGLYPSRPIMHIHAKVFQAGETGSPHTTQLYFASDANSDSKPSEARVTIAADNTASIDIATPFAAAAAEAAASSTTPASTVASFDAPDGPASATTVSSAAASVVARGWAAQRVAAAALSVLVAALACW